MRLTFSITCVITIALLPFLSLPTTAQERGAGRIAFVATRTADGNPDIFSTDLGGTMALNLTNDPAPDRSPSWSPNGREIVFASRRSNNWDLYIIQADGTGLRRLTDDPAYDGEPTWSPDGASIAWTSYRGGSLDIYTLELASGAIQRLTDDPAVDSQPAWSPDSRRIAFTSWRDGNQEIYAVTLPTGELQNLSVHPAPDYNAAFAPDGRRLAYHSDREGSGNIHVVDLLSGAQAKAGLLNRSLRDVTWTPTGGLLAVGPASYQGSRFSGTQGVILATAGMSATVSVVSSAHAYAEPVWSATARNPGSATERQEPGRIRSVAQTPVELASLPQGLLGLGDVQSGGRPMLAAAVMPSFQALRRDVIAASGHDFLSRLSEASRAVGFSSGTSSYTSWHKSGRAFDTLFDYRAGGQQVLYISPETLSGRLFWRLYLRASQQDGSQGAPIANPIFNTASGQVLPPPRGYFVDFTALAAQHGWSRIAAQERDSFNWRTQPLALEYWHFEQRGGLSWYNAMRLVYDEGTLQRLFNAEQLVAAGANPNNLSRLGLPWIPAPTSTPSGWFERPGRPR